MYPKQTDCHSQKYAHVPENGGCCTTTRPPPPPFRKLTSELLSEGGRGGRDGGTPQPERPYLKHRVPRGQEDDSARLERKGREGGGKTRPGQAFGTSMRARQKDGATPKCPEEAETTRQRGLKVHHRQQQRNVINGHGWVKLFPASRMSPQASSR